MKRDFNKVIITVVCFLTILSIALFLDYSNIVYPISKNLNYDFLNIFISNIFLIFIFLITFFLIDNKNIEKEEKRNKNRLNALNIMMYETFTTCKKVLDNFINDPYTLEQVILPNVSSKKNKGVDIVKNFQELPFNFDEQIMKMIYDGFVEEKIIRRYLEIRNLYKSYVKSKIDFYDLLHYDAKELNDLKESIKNDNRRITNLIDEELERIEINMKGK